MVVTKGDAAGYFTPPALCIRKTIRTPLSRMIWKAACSGISGGTWGMSSRMICSAFRLRAFAPFADEGVDQLILADHTQGMAFFRIQHDHRLRFLFPAAGGRRRRPGFPGRRRPPRPSSGHGPGSGLEFSTVWLSFKNRIHHQRRVVVLFQPGQQFFDAWSRCARRRSCRSDRDRLRARQRPSAHRHRIPSGSCSSRRRA